MGVSPARPDRVDSLAATNTNSSIASTPSSMMSISMMSTPASNEFPRGRPLSDETYLDESSRGTSNAELLPITCHNSFYYGLKLLESSSDEDEEGVTDKSGFTDTSYLQVLL